MKTTKRCKQYLTINQSRFLQVSTVLCVATEKKLKILQYEYSIFSLKAINITEKWKRCRIIRDFFWKIRLPWLLSSVNLHRHHFCPEMLKSLRPAEKGSVKTNNIFRLIIGNQGWKLNSLPCCWKAYLFILIVFKHVNICLLPKMSIEIDWEIFGLEVVKLITYTVKRTGSSRIRNTFRGRNFSLFFTL